MRKKLLSLALVLAMALTLLPTAALATHTPTGGTECPGTPTKVAKAASAPCTGTYQKEDYYSCTECGKTFSDAAGTTEIDVSENGADRSNYFAEGAGHQYANDFTKKDDDQHGKKCANCDSWDALANHTWGNPTQKSPADATKHEKTCSVCSGKVDEAHTWDQTATDGTANGACVCGAQKPASQAEDAKIEGISFNTETKVLSWTYTPKKNDAGESVTETVTITGPTPASDKISAGAVSGTTGKQTSQFTIAADLPDGSYVFKIKINGTEAAEYTYTKNSQSTHPTTPTTPTTPTEDPNKAPSTNAEGIPVANEVTTSSQADQAIGTLKNSNVNTLQENLLKSDSALSSFQNLENAVRVAKNVRVEVDVDRAAAPSAVRGAVSVSGAAFNAASSNTTVKLVVDAPSQAYAVASGYQISMTLTGVSNPSRLDVPVVITLPLPSDVRSDRVVVLHYHGGSSTPTTIVPVVAGNYIRFTVTGFSDFVVTDEGAAPQRGSQSGFVTVNSKKNDSGLDSATLAAIAGLLTGDGVFTDVPKEHWAAKEIRWARDGGLMSGYGTGAFGPNGATTRQQLWMVLARLDGLRPADMSVARTWAMNAGVSDGTNPNGALSRQQLVAMLYRFAKSKGVDVSASAKLSAYSDGAKVASYAKDAMSWAVGKGIVTGTGSKLNPEGTATRAHFAVFLYRYSNG